MIDRFILFLAALLGGGIGWFTGLPLGTMLGSVCGVITVQLIHKKAKPLANWVRRGIQSLIGGMIGLSVTSDIISKLPALWGPALLLMIVHVFITVIVVLILNKGFKWDLATSVCSAAPAGLSEMAILAQDFNLPMTRIVTIHIFRVLIIIATVPVLVTIL